MPQTTPLRFSLTALLALVCACWIPAAMAERADREQAMNAEADALRYDDASQTSIFTGRVVITKGSIQIRGARVEVRQDPQGYQFGTVLAGPDQIASFRQKREGVNEYIEGQAQRIEYDSRADQVKFSGQAVLRRYRGQVLSDETAGAVIVYDNRTEVFRVDGGAASASPANPSGRVRATLAPRSRAEPAAGKPVDLQPSTGLGVQP
jgi:lipopolysaccharide export system protein LptA